MLAASTSIVACYNYTGTPYVKKQVLPEVVYAYGLNESIAHGYLKDADPIGFENVKNEEFLRTSITKFWERYGGKTYEGLLPKLAIFAANVKEATDVVRPAVEKVLSELGISLSTVLVNADTYCFDSKPEKECFLQYISSNKVREIYFTGMFTSNQGDLSVQYYDPESKRLRKYYPDFLALMEDGSYQLIEVKGDNKIDDEVVLAKKAAAEEMAVASGVHYLMYAGSTLMKSNVLEPTLAVQQTSIDI